MRITCILLLSLLFAGAAPAQDTLVVVDTLDWQRYYPLEIGNTWEYEGLDPLATSTIVGDTLANGHRYFIRRDSLAVVGTLGGIMHMFYLRYDTAGTVVTLPSLEADTMEVPLPVYYSRVDFPDFLAHFDMRAAFGDTLYYGAPDTLFYVWGSYNESLQIGNERVEADALKCFGGVGFILRYECYATDIGFVGGGNLYGSELKYARVGGKEYGESRAPSTAVNDPPPVAEFSILSVYPNPMREEGSVVFTLGTPERVRIELFNALGQKVRSEGMGKQLPGQHRYRINGDGLASGVYFIHLTAGTGKGAVRSVVVHE
ncbi:MAG TPA: T9SS type A sorting domain-containing protein [Rhodothermales bacterium]|nr:T9SS type A sorting domain-containing protein [Rhodothermales bacterium]